MLMKGNYSVLCEDIKECFVACLLRIPVVKLLLMGHPLRAHYNVFFYLIMYFSTYLLAEGSSSTAY